MAAIVKKMVKMAKTWGWKTREQPNSSENSPRLILSSSTSSNENVLPNNNKYFQEPTRKPRGTSKSITQNEARQKDFI